jgi:predicted ATPase/DNA-binding CsgD family transcriptional regulator
LSQEISRRELEVLGALADHLSNAEIAQRLYISIRTVESHVASLLRKLGVADRRELAKLAPRIGTGFVTPTAIAGLPSVLTSFVGRAHEVDGLQRLLAGSRLVTLVGPGGVGKTRLALEVARVSMENWPEGAYVGLVPVGSDFVVQAVAAVFGIGERPDESLDQVLVRRLRSSRCLLILDNCEHVLASVADLVRSILEACPHVVVLATSRQRLDMGAERVFAVGPLSLNCDERGSGQSQSSEAARLFADRSSPIVPGGQDDDLVAEICRRLEGMPLAIELAAARSHSLGLDGLLTGIDDHLRLLSRLGRADDRHGSLRSVIDWSHDLLDPDEKVLFRRLGVFRGGFDLAAATQVAGSGTLAETGDLVGRLADKSLLIRSDAGGRSLWRMLDTIRAYASEQLAAESELEDAFDRHLHWAVGEARSLVGALESGQSWRESFDAVADDLRAAVTNNRGGQTGFDLAMALGHLSFARRYLAEGRDHLRAAVGLAPDDASAIAALRLAADAAFSEMRGEVAYNLLMESFDRALSAGDTRTAAIVLAEAAGLAGRAPALFTRVFELQEVADLVDRARQLGPAEDLELDTYVAIAEAWLTSYGFANSQLGPAAKAVDLARQTKNPRLISIALDAAAAACSVEHRHREAARLTAERVGLLDRMARHDPSVGGEIADIYHMATETAISTGQLDEALAIARRQAEDEATFGLAHFAANNFVIALALKGEFEEAADQAEIMLAGWEQAGRPAAGWMGAPYYAAALVHGLRGDRERYQIWRGHAQAVSVGRTAGGFSLYSDLRVALHAGDHELVQAAGPSRAPRDSAPFSPYTAAVVAEAAAITHAADRRQRLAEAEELAAENDFVAAHTTRVAGLLNGDRETLLRSVRMWEGIGARFERACTLVYIADRVSEGIRELAVLGCGPPANSGPRPR